MLTEPDIDHAALQGYLQQQYGLTIERLHFHPTYWLSVCYVAECANGERRFIRLLTQVTGTSFAARATDFYLSLLPELFRLGILTHIPLPCRTRDGDLHITFGEYDLIVYTYIDGEVVGFGKLSSDILGKLGRLVGRLHARSGEVEPIRMLGNIRGLLRPLPTLPVPPYPTEECITLPWYHIIGFVLGDNPGAFSFSKALNPANQKWQISMWYDETYTFTDMKDDFTDGPVGPFDVSDWAPNAGKADMELATAATFCEGNFDADKDVDGTDAAKFKSDFGRSGVKNPCPDCGPY